MSKNRHNSVINLWVECNLVHEQEVC